MTALTLVLATWTTAAAPGGEVTYCKDVAPILWKHCAGCHRPGEIGPFPLLTYRDAAKRAGDIVTVTQDRLMPPWKAEPGYGEFHDPRRLSDRDLALLDAWAAGGAPEGDPADLPPRPRFSEGWQLGEPDLVLRLPEPFTVRASGPDLYQCFVLPTGLDGDKAVAAVEFRPGNPRVVHHALFFLDRTGKARALDAADPAPGYGHFGGIGFLPSGALGGWAPGAIPRRLPEGMGRPLPKGSDLVLQVHYHPDGKPETDRSVVGLYFTKSPTTRFVMGLPLSRRDFAIPAGDPRYKVAVDFTLPADVRAVAITPHMHLLGREMKVTAVRPDGTVQPLIWIKDWDFNWQGSYQYHEPVSLPKGTRLEVEAS
jgi:hypothetical protein